MVDYKNLCRSALLHQFEAQLRRKSFDQFRATPFHAALRAS